MPGIVVMVPVFASSSTALASKPDAVFWARTLISLVPSGDAARPRSPVDWMSYVLIRLSAPVRLTFRSCMLSWSPEELTERPRPRR